MKPKTNRIGGRAIRVAARPAFANPTNPYNDLLYRAVCAAGEVTVCEHKYTLPPWQCDIFHLHWPEHEVFPRSAPPAAILRMTAFWIWLLVARLVGVKVVWTAHNAFPHDRVPSGLSLLVWKRFLACLDGVIFLSEESRKNVIAHFPPLGELPRAFIRHGDYCPWIDSVREKAAAPAPEVARSLKRFDGTFVILNFGLMRPYKNVDELMRRFSELDDPALRLLVAGKVSEREYMRALQALAAADQRIVLLPQYLDDASLVACLERADLVVLPYRRILNSGSALTALSFGKHVVVPATGSMPSLQQDVGVNALTLFDGPLDSAILRESIDRVRANAVAEPDLRAYKWPLLGVQLNEFYRRLLGAIRHGASPESPGPTRSRQC